MKFFFNLTLFVFTLGIFGHKSLALTDYQIREICKKEKRRLSCIKDLKEKRSTLQEGNFIEIPVIPFKR